MKNSKIITFGNQKGGVSKSTISLNVSYAMSNFLNKKVLLIDLDSQGSSSLNLGINITDDDINTIDVLLGAYVRREIKSFNWEDVKNFIYTPTYSARRRIEGSIEWETVNIPFGFDAMPSSLPLSLVELQMAIAGGQTSSGRIYSYYLYDLIECIKQNADYDYIIIDTPPSLGALSVNAMTAATSGIIIPSNLDLMSYRGILSFKESADFVQQTTEKKGIKHRGILGIVLSLYSERRSVDKALEEYVHDFYPLATFQTQIRESSDCKRATAEGLLFAQINKKAKEDFTKLSEEIEFAIENPDGWTKRNKEAWQEIKRQRGEK